MANSYTRADCISAWRFESGALATAAKGGVDLTLVGSPTEDLVNYMEGACAISLNPAIPQYARITDANLPSGFPLKSGDTTKLITVTCWVRPTTVDTNKRRIWAKWNSTGNQRSLELYHNSTQIYFNYSNTGTGTGETSLGFGPMTANQKYFISFSWDGISGTWMVRIYNQTAATWYFKGGQIPAWGGAFYVSNADWRIGADDDLAANQCFAGQIDEVLVFNSRLHNTEALAIRAGNFPVTGFNIYDYQYDPVNGDDLNNGVSAPFKTMKKPFYPGDIIHAAKSVETAQSGTATATNGSLSVTGISGWTPAQYDIIRFDNESTLYLVQTYAGGTITLYRPYRGTTGSGKVVKKITAAIVALNDFSPTYATGTVGLPITFNAGMDLATLTQDGFTIMNGNNANYYVAASLTFWNFTGKFGGYYFSASIFGNIYITDCTFESFFTLRMSLGTLYSGGWTRVTVAKLVAELGRWPGGPLYNCVINDPETAEVSQAGWKAALTLDTVVNRWKNAGYVGGYALTINGSVWGLRFVDAILDELGGGGKQIGVTTESSHSFLEDVVFHNPTIGAGQLFNYGGANFNFFGELNLVNVNGSATDHRSLIGPGPAGQNVFFVRSYDGDIFATAAPSVKITMSGPTNGPFYDRLFVPCEAGVTYAVKLKLRKNSTYGSLTRPFMRVRWSTGTPPNLVYNTHDVVMPDTVDTFEEVSYSVTPSIKGTIIVEAYFQSVNSGAIGWYDDLKAEAA